MNRRFFHAVLACGLIALSGSDAATSKAQSPRTPQRSDPAHDGVLVAINDYFQGHATGDPSHFRKAFLPTAHIEGVRDGKFTSWTLDDYAAVFKGGPASDEVTRVRTLDFIDVSGDSAIAKATLDHGATVFTDYFVLLKVGDDWKIANKVYSGRKKDNEKR